SRKHSNSVTEAVCTPRSVKGWCGRPRKKFALTLAAAVRNCAGLIEAPLMLEYPVIDNQKLAVALRSFAAERDWDQFHTPKNVATSISVEAGRPLYLFAFARET